MTLTTVTWTIVLVRDVSCVRTDITSLEPRVLSVGHLAPNVSTIPSAQSVYQDGMEPLARMNVKENALPAKVYHNVQNASQEDTARLVIYTAL